MLLFGSVTQSLSSIHITLPNPSTLTGLVHNILSPSGSTKPASSVSEQLSPSESKSNQFGIPSPSISPPPSSVSRIPSLSSSKSMASIIPSWSLSPAILILAGTDGRSSPHLKDGVLATSLT